MSVRNRSQFHLGQQQYYDFANSQALVHERCIAGLSGWSSIGSQVRFEIDFRPRKGCVQSLLDLKKVPLSIGHICWILLVRTRFGPFVSGYLCRYLNMAE